MKAITGTVKDNKYLLLTLHDEDEGVYTETVEDLEVRFNELVIIFDAEITYYNSPDWREIRLVEYTIQSADLFGEEIGFDEPIMESFLQRLYDDVDVKMY